MLCPLTNKEYVDNVPVPVCHRCGLFDKQYGLCSIVSISNATQRIATTLESVIFEQHDVKVRVI